MAHRGWNPAREHEIRHLLHRSVRLQRVRQRDAETEHGVGGAEAQDWLMREQRTGFGIQDPGGPYPCFSSMIWVGYFRQVLSIARRKNRNGARRLSCQRTAVLVARQSITVAS